jgi:filamentous hemagglutinin family protein
MTSKHNLDQQIYFIRTLLISGLFLLSALCGLSRAQGPTTITSDGTLNTTVTQNGNVFNIDDGTIRGSNQFHSFDRFSVGAGDIASFNGPVGIENILSRVTGGMGSDINGMLRSTIDGANLFLLNPAGVVFGPNASLDITGSFFVSTADFLRLGEDGIFYADPSENSLLTMAPPSAFGFLGENPPELAAGSSAAIAIDGLDAQGAPVIVVGRDGTPEGSADGVEGVAVTGELTSEGGQVTLASVAAPGEIPLTDSGSVSLFDESGDPLLSKLGTIEISDEAVIDVSGNSGGTVFIRGGVLMVENASVSADTRGDEDGAAIGIDVQMSEKITLMGESEEEGDADDEFRIGFFSSSEGAGRGGNIEVKAPEILLSGESQIVSETRASGQGGDVMVTADTVTLTDDAEIASDVENTGTASGGDVWIRAARITLESGAEDSPEISSDTEGAGAGGDVTLNASEEISIRIREDEGGIFSNSKGGSGDSGNISLETARLEMDGGVITAGTETAGDGGDIRVTAAEILLSGESQIVSETKASGKGGDIVVIAGTLTLTDDAEIASDVEDTGTADAIGGNVTITADRITLESGAEDSPEISSDTEGAGAGGIITLDASEEIRIRIQGEEGGVFTNSKNGTGASGSIIFYTPSLEMDGGVITARTETVGKGGNVEIHAGRIRLSSGAAISAKSTSDAPGAGLAGNVTLTDIDTLHLSENSSVTTEAAVADGGNITILAESEVRLRDGKITTAVGRGDGGGGNIFIDPEFVILEGFSQIIANAFGGPGGNIDIIADAFLADAEKSIVSASSVLGVDGQINIDAITDLSGAITPLQERYSEAAALLRQRCAERLRGGQVSSFIVGGRDGVPLEPGELLPSPPYMVEAPVVSGRGGRQEYTPRESAGFIGFDEQGHLRIRGWSLPGFSQAWLNLECAGWVWE